MDCTEPSVLGIADALRPKPRNDGKPHLLLAGPWLGCNLAILRESLICEPKAPVESVPNLHPEPEGARLS